MNIERYQEMLKSNTQEIIDIDTQLAELEKEEKNDITTNRINSLRIRKARLRNEQRTTQQILEAYQNMLENIIDYRELSDIRPVTQEEIDELSELMEQREAEIRNARRILPEELQEEIRNQFTTAELGEVNENVDTEDKTETPTPNAESTDSSSNEIVLDQNSESSMLSPTFNPHGMTKEEFIKKYHAEAIANETNPENLAILNNINNEMKEKWRKERENPLFRKDENGNVIYYPNTSIPAPRARRIDESEEDYNKFLHDEFGKALEAGNYFNKTNLNNKQQADVPKLPDNGKKLPAVVPENKDKSNGQQPNPVVPEGKDKNKEKQLPAVVPENQNKNNGQQPNPVVPEGKDKNKEKQLPAVVPENKDKNKEKQPDPKEPENKTKPTSNIEPKTSRKTLQQIMYELQKDLEIKRKSGQRYQAANIKVARNFKNELQSGNWLYNVFHIAPTAIKSVVGLAKKLYSKAILHFGNQKETMEVLEERINKLSEADLQVIWDEYRGSQVNQDSFTTALNNMLNDRIQRFAQNKVEKINSQISAGYQKIFADYKVIQEIDKKLTAGNINEEEKKRLTSKKQALLAGKAEQIGKLRDLYIKGNQYYSGGAHGFSEDMKAARTKLSKQGKAFAKTHDYDDELQAQKANLEMRERKAIEEKDDLAAIKAFINYETLKSNETEIHNHLLGKRSTGKMYYSPLVGELDYRDDPLVRDIFSTIAIVGASVSAINAFKTHGVEANQILQEEQAKADQINASNNQMMNQVNKTGQNIADHRETFEKGMQAQANSDVINTLNTGERSAYDQDALVGNGSHGGYGSTYRAADEIAHQTAKQSYQAAEQQLQDIANRYAQNQLTQGQVMQEVANVANQTNQTLNEMIQSALPYFKEYASAHQNFDLGEVGKAMEYLVENPDAIAAMNQGMVNVTSLGASLTGLSAQQVEALQSLPSDMLTTLCGAAATAALAYKTAVATHAATVKNGKYGNEITDMVEEYVTNQAQENENQNQRRV